MDSKELSNSKEKKYNKIKIRLTIIDLLITLGFFTAIAFTPVSKKIVAWLTTFGVSSFQNDYILFLVYIFFIGFVLSVIGFPIDFYGGYIVEKKFNLSNQTIAKWCLEKLKGVIVSLVIGVPVAILFYFCLRRTGVHWWFYFSTIMFILSVFLAKIAPVVIFPLFYKFTELEDGDIKSKINRLMEKYQIIFKGIFSFNLSKNTKKANAAFTGLGKTKRIILSDTLVNDFTAEEIEVVFAHELGHYKKKHIIKNILFSTVTIYLSFFLCGLVYSLSLPVFGYSSISDIAAIPLLIFYLSIFSILMMPLTNAISRAYEREADSFALTITNNKTAFISSMEKLAKLNLADKDPHPVTEFMLYSHPSIKKRIDFAKKF